MGSIARITFYSTSPLTARNALDIQPGRYIIDVPGDSCLLIDICVGFFKCAVMLRSTMDSLSWFYLLVGDNRQHCRGTAAMLMDDAGPLQ